MISDKEIFDIALAKRDEYETKRKERNKKLAVGFTALGCAVLVAAGGAALKKTGSKIFAGKSSEQASNEVQVIDGTDIEDYSYLLAYGNGTDTEEITGNSGYENSNSKEIDENTREEMTETDGRGGAPSVKPGDENRLYETTAKPAERKTEQNTDVVSTPKKESGTPSADGGSEAVYGGVYANNYLSSKNISGLCVKIKGTGITDDELEKYIKENAKSIVSGIAFDSKYGGNGEYKICTKGYSHLTTDENGLWINIDFVDCIITKNGKIVGIVTVFKDNGKLHNSVAYGGAAFGNLQKAFDENPGKELVFVYDGMTPEILISPDNKMYFNPCAVEYDKGFDYYSAFRTEGNTFSSEDLKNNFIKIEF